MPQQRDHPDLYIYLKVSIPKMELMQFGITKAAISFIGRNIKQPATCMTQKETKKFS